MSQFFSFQSGLNQDTFSDRDQFSLKHHQVFGSNESFIRFSNPANVAKSLFDGNRDDLLIQARSELMKQEHKVESLNNCINELQQQAYAQRLYLENTHHGYVLNLEEYKCDYKETMHEMGEMKRAQQFRVDEFSAQKLRESHETIQRLTSQVQERMNYLNDSGELHEVESNYSGKFSQSTSKDSKSAIHAELRQTHAT